MIKMQVVVPPPVVMDGTLPTWSLKALPWVSMMCGR